MKKTSLLFLSVLAPLAGIVSAEEINFREQPEKYWDFNQLKEAPAFRDAPFADSQAEGLRAVMITGYGPAKGGKIPTRFEKQNPLSSKVRSEFFAYIGFPSGPVPKGGFPGIVLIHGGGGTAFASYAKHWIGKGYAVIALDWYNQRPVKKSSGETGSVPLPGEKRQDHVSNVANIILCHSLLRSLKEVNPEKTAFVGLSWGSWYGAMVAAVDDRFKGGVEIYCGDVNPGSKSFINGRFHHAAKIPLYWVGGTNDQNVTPESLNAAFKECPKLENKSMVIRLPHSHVGFTFDSCSRMAAHFTQGKPGLPKLSDITQKGCHISAKVLDPGMGIQSAILCYTDSTEKVCHKRLWKSIPAKIEGNIISAELPVGAHQFFLSAYDGKSSHNDLCGSTSVVILPVPHPARNAAVSAAKAPATQAPEAGKNHLKNGSFTELDEKGKLKAWTLKNAEAVKKNGRTMLVIHKDGQAHQLIYDWKGPLGQSPEPRSIQINIRASGNALLAVYAATYTDDWSGGKLKRKFHGSEKIEHVKLKPEVGNYTSRYTIKANQWIGLFIHSFGGETEIENVSVTKE